LIDWLIFVEDLMG